MKPTNGKYNCMFCCNGVGLEANTSAEAASGNSIDTVKQLIRVISY